MTKETMYANEAKKVKKYMLNWKKRTGKSFFEQGLMEILHNEEDFYVWDQKFVKFQEKLYKEEIQEFYDRTDDLFMNFECKASWKMHYILFMKEQIQEIFDWAIAIESETNEKSSSIPN